MKKQHRVDEDNIQNEILELQGKKNVIDNGEFLFHVYFFSLPVGPCLTILSFNPIIRLLLQWFCQKSGHQRTHWNQ